MSWCSSQSQLSDKHLFCSSIHVVIVLANTVYFGTSCSDEPCCSACAAHSSRYFFFFRSYTGDSAWHLVQQFSFSETGFLECRVVEFQKRYQIGHIELMHRMVDESKYIMLIQTIVTDCVHMWCYICGLWVVMSINYKFKYRAQNTMNTSWYVQFIRTQTFNECSQ